MFQVERDPCFDLVEREYMFYLSFENSICTDYITEKVYNALALNTVPVVMAGEVGEDRLPPHSVIDALQYSPQQLADRLYHLIQHAEEYQQYFQWKQV